MVLIEDPVSLTILEVPSAEEKVTWALNHC